MADYISRENMQGQIVKAAEKCQIKLFDESVNVILQILQNIPAADVQPVKRGRWIGVDYDTFFECSECKHMTDWQNYKYCPYCGARMDGEQK